MKAQLESIRAADPEGIWLTQTWVFIDFELWTKENILLKYIQNLFPSLSEVSAFLSGVEGSDSMILLDLMSDLVLRQPAFLFLETYLRQEWR